MDDDQFIRRLNIAWSAGRDFGGKNFQVGHTLCKEEFPAGVFTRLASALDLKPAHYLFPLEVESVGVRFNGPEELTVSKAEQSSFGYGMAYRLIHKASPA